MTFFAILIGVYSYLIFFLGVFSILTPIAIAILSLPFLVITFYLLKKNLPIFLKYLFKLGKIERLLMLLIALSICVNLIGALGPELAFDALWYHATLAKIYSLTHSISYIRGGLFYYSLMPRLTEMVYASALSLGIDNLKLIHFAFGMLSLIFLYKIAIMYLPKKYALLVVAIYYSNPVVMWLSTTAYSDLSRSFFEIGALFYFLKYWKQKSKTFLIISAILLGFAICTKLISIGTLLIFVFVIMVSKQDRQKIKSSILFSMTAFLVASPWFVASFYYTSNPVYPLFTHLNLPHSPFSLLSPLTFLNTFISIFLYSPDPISPFYISILPLFFFKAKVLLKKFGLLFLLATICYLVWYFTSQSGGARFLSSYLPLYTLCGILAVRELKKKALTFFMIITVGVIFINISYRFVANLKYIPVIVGIQTKQDFLMKHLNFDFGDFFDENSDISNIVGNNTVLLVNMHNLFYIDFPFTLAEWGSSSFKYVLVQQAILPSQYKKATQIYKNDMTHVTLYKL